MYTVLCVIQHVSSYEVCGRRNLESVSRGRTENRHVLLYDVVKRRVSLLKLPYAVRTVPR